MILLKKAFSTKESISDDGKKAMNCSFTFQSPYVLLKGIQLEFFSGLQVSVVLFLKSRFLIQRRGFQILYYFILLTPSIFGVQISKLEYSKSRIPSFWITVSKNKLFYLRSIDRDKYVA